jgi:Mg-chelatase subunit ChlD
MKTKRIGFVLAGVVLLAWSPDVSGQCAMPGTDDGPIDFTTGEIDFHVHYEEGECGDAGHVITVDRAQDVADTLDLAYDWYVGFGFGPAHLNTLPDYHAYIYDIAGWGVAYSGCINIDAPSFRCDTDEIRISKTTQHEYFHSVQRAHKCAVADCDSGGIGSTFGSWVSEGQARCTDDRFSDDLDSATFNGSYRNSIVTTFNVPERSLLDHSYRTALFWSYCCEQMGVEDGEPEAGIDFMLRFWEQIAANATTDGVVAIEDAIGNAGGGSLDDVFLDYVITNYVHGLDLSALSAAEQELYIFVDEQQALDQGEDPYPEVDTIAATIPENGCGDDWPTVIDVDNHSGQYAFHVYEADVNVTECQVVGFRGESREDCSLDDDLGEDMGWAVLGVNSSDEVMAVSRGEGQEFGRSFFVSPTDPIDKLVAVVAGLSNATEYEYWFDSGPAEITIIRPTVTRLAYPGPAMDPGRFLVRVYVQGPADLEPLGVGPRSVLGLETADFTVTVGTGVANVISTAYVGGEYWLVVEAPTQVADGLYDLTVTLCLSSATPVTETSPNSVLYGDMTVNHVVVIDKSGSMGRPTGNTKLDAAKIAASLYVDAVSDDDRVGLVVFDGNTVDCDDDADLLESLGTADATQRDDVKTAIQGLGDGGWTSIGDGLWKAQDELDLFPDPDDVHTILLLSDGKGNEARYWDTPAACDTARSRIVPEDTVINTISFGPEADQPRMQDIAADTDGDHTYVDVEEGSRTSTLSMRNDLADAYMGGLQHARGMERVFFDSGTIAGGPVEIDIPVTEPAPIATFFFNVDDPAANLTVELTDATGAAIASPTATIYSTSTHVVYHMNVPLVPGMWHATLNVSRTAEYIAGLLTRDPQGPELTLQFAQIRIGSLPGLPPEGRFELGRPVSILAMLTDGNGPVLGARLTVRVKRPDGVIGCGLLELLDDGKQGDGQANDGVYGGRFTQTSIGCPGGVVNDDPRQPPPPGSGIRGSYEVTVEATGVTNNDVTFTRMKKASFVVFGSSNDQDQDRQPDTWERHYGTNPFEPDATADFDEDGLVNRDELEHGTDPRDPDTDDGGETDGSEVNAGRCPLDPVDDALPPMVDIEVVTDVGDEGGEVIIRGANLLRFPWHPAYQDIRVTRSIDLPENFSTLAVLDETEASDGNYYDTDVLPGRQYFYRLEPRGTAHALGRRSHVITAIGTRRWGDYDGDGIVDLRDHVDLCECMFGPDELPVPTPPQTPPECLRAFDADFDLDIDLDDWRVIQPAMGE